VHFGIKLSFYVIPGLKLDLHIPVKMVTPKRIITAYTVKNSDQEVKVVLYTKPLTSNPPRLITLMQTNASKKFINNFCQFLLFLSLISPFLRFLWTITRIITKYFKIFVKNWILSFNLSISSRSWNSMEPQFGWGTPRLIRY